MLCIGNSISSAAELWAKFIMYHYCKRYLIFDLFQEFSDDEEERRMKRAEKAKRKAASSTSDGEVVAAESDDSRQGATELHKFLN